MTMPETATLIAKNASSSLTPVDHMIDFERLSHDGVGSVGIH